MIIIGISGGVEEAVRIVDSIDHPDPDALGSLP